MKTRCVQLMKTTPAFNPSFFSLVWIINKNTNSANHLAKRTQWLSSIGPEKVTHWNHCDEQKTSCRLSGAPTLIIHKELPSALLEFQLQQRTCNGCCEGKQLQPIPPKKNVQTHSEIKSPLNVEIMTMISELKGQKPLYIFWGVIFGKAPPPHLSAKQTWFPGLFPCNSCWTKTAAWHQLLFGPWSFLWWISKAVYPPSDTSSVDTCHKKRINKHSVTKSYQSQLYWGFL